MPGRDDEYCLTLNQKSIDTLLKLRGRLITSEEVLQLNSNLTYEEALDIASRCNEMLVEVQRYLYRKI